MIVIVSLVVVRVTEVSVSVVVAVVVDTRVLVTEPE
jgi:hypothetical protein